MQLGVSYYPELTDESAWNDDLLAMRQCGLTIVRVGEFAWSALEPREGSYQFDWMDRFIGLVANAGMRLVLCTPTATPPPWMTTQYPEMLIVRRDGTRHHPGGRRDVDVDSEVFRYFSAQIASELGRRYGHHAAVLGWQIDNELIGPEGEPPESHSPATTFHFRQYLKTIHGDLATLNRRWGTRFWSQEYSDWGEVTTPLNARTTMGQVLDYSRYFSASLARFVELQVKTLRAVIAPGQWISHNATAVFDRGIDHVEMGRSLDVLGWDAYPGAAGRPFPHVFSALAHDLFRSARHKAFWVFETSAMSANLSPAHLGQMLTHGAEAALMWHWREHPANAENESDAFCDYAGRPDRARSEKARTLLRRLHPATDLAASHSSKASVALMFCPDCVRVSLTPDPYMKRGLDNRVSYLRVLIETYRVLWRAGVRMDVVRPDDSLAGYSMVVLPSARLLSESACDRVRTFVMAGGTLLAVAKNAHQDQWGAYHSSPGQPLADLLGFTQCKAINLPADTPLQATWDSRSIACLPWAERVEPTHAEVLARFTTGGRLADAPAALKAKAGKGSSYYAAACSEGLVESLLALATNESGVKAYAPLGADVGLFPHPDGQSVWVFNYEQHSIEVAGKVVEAGDFDRVPSAALKPLKATAP